MNSLTTEWINIKLLTTIMIQTTLPHITVVRKWPEEKKKKKENGQ